MKKGFNFVVLNIFFLESNSFILSPKTRIASYLKKPHQELKDDSARQNLSSELKSNPANFDKFTIENELPHFGANPKGRDENKYIKTEPGLFMSRSFNFGPDNRTHTQPSDDNKNDKSIIDDKSPGIDQSVLNCLICFDSPPNAVFMDCGHGGTFFKEIVNKFIFF